MAVLAVSGLAFSQASKTHGIFNETWFLIENGNPDNADHYTLVPTSFECDTNGDVICSIQAPEVEGRPQLTQPVSSNPAAYDATFREE